MAAAATTNEKEAAGGVAAHVAAAETAAATGDWAKGREFLLRALDVDPNSADLHGRMAYYTFQAGRAGLPDAQRLTEHHLNAARETGPNLPFALYWSGRIAVAEGNQPRARLQLQAALALAPTFTPAQQAIDRLDTRPQEKPEVRNPGAGARASRNKKTTLVLGLVLVVGGVASAVYNLMPDMALSRLARNLGAEFPILSASQVPPELMIEIGEAWNTMPPATRDADVAAMAQRAHGMGYRSFVVYSAGRHVAQLSSGDNCPSGKCAVKQQEEKQADGTAKISVEMTPVK